MHVLPLIVALVLGCDQSEGPPAEATQTAKPTAAETTPKADPPAKTEKTAKAGATTASPAEAPADLPAPDDVGAVPADATKTESGLAYRVLTSGTGSDKPNANSKVTVHYSGWMTNGKMFDSSVTRGSPATFPLNRVIKGWTEGLQLMVQGEKTRFWIPADLAYGDSPSRPGGPSGMLVFDVELLSIAE